MDKYLLVYYGGNLETDPKKLEEGNQKWGKWFMDLGKTVVDAGNPTMPVKSVGPKGVKTIGAKPVTGYSIFTADSLDSAIALAKTSPQIDAGGTIDVYKIMPVM